MNLTRLYDELKDYITTFHLTTNQATALLNRVSMSLNIKNLTEFHLESRLNALCIELMEKDKEWKKEGEKP